MTRSTTLNRILLLFVALLSAFTGATPLRHAHAQGAMAFVTDDFYYYAAIARNIHAGLGSTFDGTTLTNGYHPLYTLLLVPFVRGTRLVPLFACMAALFTAASITTFLAARYLYTRAGSSTLTANALALLTLALPFRMFFQGMEVTLTIPLEIAWMACMFAILQPARMRTAAALGAGALAALTIFSRLDSAIFLALACAFLLAQPDVRRRLTPRATAAFAAASALPVLAYVAYNRLRFGTLLPVSGMAKQMRTSHTPSRMAFESIWRGGNTRALVAIVLMALLLWIWQRRQLPAVTRALTLAAILFPILHIGTLALLSDWQMWGWYHYSFVPATVAFFVLAAHAWHAQSLRAAPALRWSMLAVAAAITLTNHWRVDSEMLQIATTAEQLQPFLQQHPGTYAMGDRAGMVAWLSPAPIFQTEGLVEDRAWLNTLRAQGDLLQALRSRGVRYFITTVWLNGVPRGRIDQRDAPPGCILAVEPAQAGPSAPHLRSTICAKPVASLLSGGDISKQTLVYDIQP